MIIFHVYYHANDGAIFAITPIVEDSELPFVTIDEAAGHVFTSGECSIQDYYVDLDLIETGFPLVKRVVKTVTLATTTDFEAIDDQLKTNNIIAVFPDVIRVTFDQNDPDITKVLLESAEFGYTFPSYLTAFNNPDIFVEEVRIDTRKLIAHGSVELPRKYSTVNVSMFSNHIMKMFRLERHNES